MKLGIIYLSYGRSELEEKALIPFLKLRESGVCKIAAASSVFPEYSDLIEDKETFKRLKNLRDNNKIDFLYNNSITLSESSLRSLLLNQLRDCEYILLWDADELIEAENITKMLEFADRKDDIYYFDLAFKQYFRDEKHHLGIHYFKRLYRNKQSDPLKSFYFDCDGEFSSGRDFSKPKSVIPEHILTVRHLTWTNDVSKVKIEYQKRHFGHEDLCSFKWDDQNKQVVLNDNHYIKYNKPIPQIYEET